MPLFELVASLNWEVAGGSTTQHLENSHRNIVQGKHSFIQLGIVHVERLAKFELINQLVHEANRYRKVVLRGIKMVLLVKHIIHKYFVLPQEAFE